MCKADPFDGRPRCECTNDLLHSNIINNARFLGDALALTDEDVICCPPPLFHCFGLVMGFLGAFTRGCTIVFPSQQFDAGLIVDAVDAERCTVLHGVPTMFGAELDVLARQGRKLTSLTRALAAGAPVPPSMVKRLKEEMGIQSVIIAYGMTETSPVTFATTVHDSYERRLTTVGKVFPHTKAKIIDLEGNTVPCGVPGEICTSGYALQKGYLKNEAKTQEAMCRDDDGTLWMLTGDKGIIDSEGYCQVTGRIKDMIIRGKLHPQYKRDRRLITARPGGENIAPAEIEERLLSHESIVEAAVVGAPHHKYGEQVVAFVKLAEGASRPCDADVAAWVREALARHKSPAHTLWIGDDGVGNDFPKTASGKHQKHILRDIAVALLRPNVERARL
jgi:acyl-CoA synthetase (AMP-forming)/AMP-acid ligase II